MLRGLLCSIWSGPCASYYCGSVCFCYPHFVSVWKFPWTFSINIYSILRMEMRMGRVGSAAGGDLPKCQTYEVPRDCKAGLSRNQEAESWKRETEAFISLSQLIFLFISMFVILAVVYIPGMQELHMESQKYRVWVPSTFQGHCRMWENKGACLQRAQQVKGRNINYPRL